MAWESATTVYTKYITDSRYQKFSPEVRKWYKPYRCSACTEPRAEVTDPFRDLLAALIDIYDDERNNAPEDRCYVEGAWSEVLGEARALLAPLPDPAQVAAESPDWIKNALPPEGA
ncbi:hypothetical protein [Burkholderia cenocepacia]|uniref:hypothetical protein n=1 Tax=Burkholderia cenocepacia TaxID=95486 RepID=UPI002231145A|nr:hypothetical protein [Burkholderia cenocepacia]